MPIRPSEKHRYPPPKEWKKIRAAILDRAGNCCEGSPKYPDCRAPNGVQGVRVDGEFLHGDRLQKYAENYASCCSDDDEQPAKLIKIVLTIAHLDHVPENNDPANLRALCQRCHLAHDAGLHAENARATRDRKAGQGRLFEK